MPPTLAVEGGILVAAPPPPEPTKSLEETYRLSWDRWVSMFARDWIREFRGVWKTVVFVARYGNQRIDDVERWPISKLFRVATFVGQYLEEEHKKGGDPFRSRGGAPR